jgi:hypothetical protein
MDLRADGVEHIVQFEDSSVVEIRFGCEKIERSTIENTGLVDQTLGTVERLESERRSSGRRSGDVLRLLKHCDRSDREGRSDECTNRLPAERRHAHGMLQVVMSIAFH